MPAGRRLSPIADQRNNQLATQNTSRSGVPRTTPSTAAAVAMNSCQACSRPLSAGWVDGTMMSNSRSCSWWMVTYGDKGCPSLGPSSRLKFPVRRRPPPADQGTPISGSPFLAQGDSGAGLLIAGGSRTTFTDSSGKSFAIIGPSGDAVARWAHQPSIQITSAASGSDALVILGTTVVSDLGGHAESVVQRLDAKTGKKLWAHKLGSTGSSSYGAAHIGGNLIEIGEVGEGRDDNGSLTRTYLSHFLDVESGKELFSFTTCDLAGTGFGTPNGQGVVSLEPFITRAGHALPPEKDGRITRPCDTFGPAEIRSATSGEVIGSVSEKALPSDYDYETSVRGSGKNLVVVSGNLIKAVTPSGKQVWTQDAVSPQLLAADDSHVIVMVRQTHKVVVLDAKTGEVSKSISDPQDDIEAAVLAGAQQMVIGGSSGAMTLYSLG
jgi:hypothetical protein